MILLAECVGFLGNFFLALYSKKWVLIMKPVRHSWKIKVHLSLLENAYKYQMREKMSDDKVSGYEDYRSP